jgi:hypothetical protein
MNSYENKYEIDIKLKIILYKRNIWINYSIKMQKIFDGIFVLGCASFVASLLVLLISWNSINIGRSEFISGIILSVILYSTALFSVGFSLGGNAGLIQGSVNDDEIKKDQ